MRDLTLRWPGALRRASLAIGGMVDGEARLPQTLEDKRSGLLVVFNHQDAHGPPSPKSLRPFQVRFANEEACQQCLVTCRWPEGYDCCNRRRAAAPAARRGGLGEGTPKPASTVPTLAAEKTDVWDAFPPWDDIVVSVVPTVNTQEALTRGRQPSAFSKQRGHVWLLMAEY